MSNFSRPRGPNGPHMAPPSRPATPEEQAAHEKQMRTQAEAQAKMARLVTRQQIAVMLLTGEWNGSKGALGGVDDARDIAMVNRAYDLAELIMDVGSKRL